MAHTPRITILTPVYNEEAGLARYVERVRAVLLGRTDASYRVLFIDDGSADESWRIIREICAADPAFSGIRLSRNFGSHMALTAGFDHVDADAVAVLACDLQDPPETVLDFVEKWRGGAKIVWGRRKSRRDEGWRVAASGLFNTLLRRFAMPRGSKFTTGSFLLVDRLVVDCLRRFREQSRITFALVAWTGFDQEVVDYDRAERATGVSGWSFARMMKTFYDAFIGFSTTPVKLVTRLGLAVCAGSLLFLAYLLFTWATGNPIPGWTSLMFLVTGFFGLQFLVTGVMGEYLQRIYMEALGRPLYFISEATEAREQRP